MHSRPLFLAIFFLGFGVAVGASDPKPGVQAGASAPAVINAHYQAGSFHRWLWGDGYRDLWTARLAVDVLDLQKEAGGLQPLFRVGGQETKGLAMKGKDGRDYTFRAIDKDPTQILPAELRDTWARDVVQDQMSAQHPAGAVVVDELLAAAGILHSAQRLVIMPDDPALGEFRKEFAGVVGQFYEFPGAVSDKNPGFRGATDVLKHKDFYARIASGPDERIDTRAFLKARLFDLLVGDWDRHRDQWRWVKFPGNPLWEPFPDDRDQAFSRYEGLVIELIRRRQPILQKYSGKYPDHIKGLTWNGWEQDRQFFAGVDRSLFREVAAELKAQVTDEVIDRAAHRMPPEYFKTDGPRLIRFLRGRRDRLVEGAEAFYEHLADKVRVELTNAPEYVEIQRLEGGDLQVKVFRRGADGGPTGEPLLQRTLHAKETEEVQVYLEGGDDKVVAKGKTSPIKIRVIGGQGHDVVEDSEGGGTRFYEKGKGRAYVAPPPPKNAPWVPTRDWGRDTFWVPWISYGSDLGVFAGIGLDTRAYAFHKDPYANRQILRAGWAFGEGTFRADYKGQFRMENSGVMWGIYAYASGIESGRFFGFGNETTDGGRSNSDVFKVKQQQYSLTPTISLPLTHGAKFSLGPTVRYSTASHPEEATVLNAERPYGFGDFGEVGATAMLSVDSRVSASRTPGGVAVRSMGYPRSGALLDVRGQVFPKAWDVKETYGAVDGNASAYLTPGGERAPTLALRVGGRKAFGNYPFFDAAYLGGGLGGFGVLPGDESVRGLQKHRYAGDAALYGNVDLRIYVSRFRIFLPGEWGVVGFADGGRVYLTGESSNTWHSGFGGGLWFAWLDRANTISFSYARSERRNAFYVKAGFAF